MGWDTDGAPHTVALARTGRSEQEPDRLPEVRELAEFGWEPAPDAPMWGFLPYVWPEDRRTWVPDRSTRWAVETRLDATGTITGATCQPLSQHDLDVLENDANTDLAEAGVPPRPPGRLWLLRPIADHEDIDSVLDHLFTMAETHGIEARSSAAFAALCADELRSLDATARVRLS
ncbi:DUF5956 family protein [Streptomyces jumonjinensis]|uniref:Uncharacterized protein n=1 Tax=Streptomyces jumonjinensis TaxID=1945 RepID=A0A646KMW7_STRJU|nr:DUF5956 family protein [Streptomyces jumonjinensis]MQT03430.1 hypothetical protein [Streptomyces jumonjinensis]